MSIRVKKLGFSGLVLLLFSAGKVNIIYLYVSILTSLGSGNERETDYSGRQSVSVSVGEAGSAQPVGGGIGVSAGLMTRSGKEGRWREEYNRVGQLEWRVNCCPRLG